MTCIYSIVPRVRTPSINAGHPVEVEIFLTGYGNNVKESKFQISYSSPKLFAVDNEGKVGFLEFCIKVVKDNKGNVTGVLSGDEELIHPETKEVIRAIHRHSLDSVGTTVKLTEAYFMSRNETRRLSGEKIDPYDLALLSEMTHDGYPPMLLKFNTLPNATQGDHNIVLTLFYSDGSDLKMDQKVVTFHIRNWVEKHQKAIHCIAVALGLSALSAGIIQAIYTVLQYLATHSNG